jgi:hypothetical protein
MVAISDDVIAYIYTWLNLSPNDIVAQSINLHNPLMLRSPVYQSTRRFSNIPREHGMRFMLHVRCDPDDVESFPNASSIIVNRPNIENMRVYEYMVRTKREKYSYGGKMNEQNTLIFLSAESLKTLVVKNAILDYSTLPSSLEHLYVKCVKYDTKRTVLPDNLVNLKTLDICSEEYNDIRTYIVPESCTALRHISTVSSSINLLVHADVLRGIEELEIEDADDYSGDFTTIKGYVNIRDIPSKSSTPNMIKLTLKYSLPPVTEVNGNITHLCINYVEDEDISEFVAKFPSLEFLELYDSNCYLKVVKDTSPHLRRINLDDFYGGLEICNKLSEYVSTYKDGCFVPPPML